MVAARGSEVEGRNSSLNTVIGPSLAQHHGDGLPFHTITLKLYQKRPNGIAIDLLMLRTSSPYRSKITRCVRQFGGGLWEESKMLLQAKI